MKTLAKLSRYLILSRLRENTLIYIVTPVITSNNGTFIIKETAMSVFVLIKS